MRGGGSTPPRPSEGWPAAVGWPSPLLFVTWEVSPVRAAAIIVLLATILMLALTDPSVATAISTVMLPF